MLLDENIRKIKIGIFKNKREPIPTARDKPTKYFLHLAASYFFKEIGQLVYYITRSFGLKGNEIKEKKRRKVIYIL
jgi:hypothetical protein